MADEHSPDAARRIAAAVARELGKAKTAADPAFVARLPTMTVPQLLTELQNNAEAAAMMHESTVSMRERQRRASAHALLARTEIEQRLRLHDQAERMIERVIAALVEGLTTEKGPELKRAKDEAADAIDALTRWTGAVTTIAEELERGARLELHHFDEHRYPAMADRPGLAILRRAVHKLDELTSEEAA